MRDMGEKKDREPGLLRTLAVLVGAVVGQYIAGRVFDLIRKHR
jgi:hypothetical protein